MFSYFFHILINENAQIDQRIASMASIRCWGFKGSGLKLPDNPKPNEALLSCDVADLLVHQFLRNFTECKNKNKETIASEFEVCLFSN
jgi:hypothetical protein